MESELSIQEFNKAALSIEKELSFHALHLELRHSESIAAILENHPEAVCSLFNLNSSEKHAFRVEREEKNRDLSIHVVEEESKKEKIYIIENKLQSIPYEEQLQRYQKKAGKSFGGGILLGPLSEEPSWIKKCHEWKYLSYKALLNEFWKLRSLESYELEYLRMTNDMISALEDLNKLVGDKIPSKSELSELQFRKFHPLVQKQKVSQLISRLQENEILKQTFKEVQEKTDYKLELKVDFSHSLAKLNCYFVAKTGNTDFSMIGVEIQDNSYNYCAIVEGAKPEEVYKKEVDVGWIVPEETLGKKHSNKKYNTTDFYAYTSKGSDRPFVYRRKQVKMEFEILEKMLEKDIQRLKGILIR